MQTHRNPPTKASQQATGSLELVVGGDQHDFVGLLGAFAAAGPGFAILTGLDHLLGGLLGVLLVGWGEVVDGVLHYVPRIDGLLQATGDAVHGGHII